MKVYQEVYLKAKSLTDEEIIEALKKFAQQVDGWKLMTEQSMLYAQGAGTASCVIALEADEFYPGFAITKKKDQVFYVVNIVHRESGFIPMSKYNVLAKRFATDFQEFTQIENVPISVIVTKEDIGLKEIISSLKVREALERFLHCNPASTHPADIRRLDVFICLASRYCRKPVNEDLLQRFLHQELGWTKENAEKCRDRIHIGLTILKLNKQL